MAKNLMCVFFVIALSYSLCHSASITDEKVEAKTDIRNKRTANKISDLKTKLSQLQKLLDDIEKDKTTNAPVQKTTTAAPHSGEENKEKGENTLSEADILLLKSLKTAMENMRDENQVDKKEILEKVVYRLLSDLDLALKNGISVEDIIKYLYETEEAARKKQQGNRIEEEERQLRALLNKEPAPRD